LELRYAPLAQGQAQKLICGYDWLEREFDIDSPVHVGHIAVATALSWLEFRELPGFRAARPRLARWFDAFCARKSMLATPLSGETHD
jgi:glutathione S-transferase